VRKLEISDIKNRKFYSTNTYRLRVKLLQYSIYITIAEIIILALMYLTRPEPLYFATNSASAIKPLVAMSEPNMSSEALLPPDIPEETGAKELLVG
jgi:intracellular multiplication protein IcmM